MASPFLTAPAERWVAHNELAFALRDGFPVSPGHTLVVPRRLVATWFEATRAEQVAILELIDAVKARLDAELRPDGYNVGFNVGAAAGQTVMHLHVHVIPRFAGDVQDPRGGVRHVVPGKGNYLAAGFVAAQAPAAVDSRLPVRAEALATGGVEDPLARHLRPLFARAREVAILVAFAQESGLAVVEPLLEAALAGGSRVRVVVGDYLGITQPSALSRLLAWTARQDGSPAEVRVVEAAGLATRSRSFHAKAWVVLGDGFGAAFVGSSNLSAAALGDGVEWNLRIDRERDPAGFLRVVQAFEDWWERAVPLSRAWIDAYRERAPERLLPERVTDDRREEVVAPPEPHDIQREALAALDGSRADGRQRALVVMATGLGKTWLAGFDLRGLASDLGRAPRLLWLAHRDELLRQAQRTLERLFPAASKGFFGGNHADLDAQLVFASVQKLSRPEHLARLSEQRFDYAVVDEAHHAAAKSYRAVLGALRAEFVLGLTATPDRTDQADIQALLDDHLAFDAGLHRGIEAGLLAPFAYYGLKDSADYQNIPWRNGKFEPEALAVAVQTQARMERCWQGWQDHPGRQTLVFCCTIAHAEFVRQWLAQKGVRAVAVHSAEGSADVGEALRQLGQGELDAVCAVDLLSEGIDVPSVDRVVMLRPSESPVVFLQQLGRGLRRAFGKERLTVIDFVGNHRVFLQRLRTLLDTVPASAGRVGLAEWLQSAAKRAETALPPGCLVDLELAAIDLLAEMLPRADRNEAVRAFRELVEVRGERPTAGELYRQGLNPRVKGYASWFAFVAAEGHLKPAELQVLAHAGSFLADLDVTKMTKSYKLVTLQTLAEADALLTGMEVAELCRRAHAVLLRSPELAKDLDNASDLGDPRHPDPAAWRAYWRKNPLAAWLGESADKHKRPWFVLRQTAGAERFEPKFDVPAELAPTLAAMVAELVDWRLAEYRARARAPVSGEAGAFECKLLRNDRHAILKHPGAKSPWANRVLEARVPGGEPWRFNFAAEFCNVAHPATSTGASNRLGDLLVRLFGEQAGRPGTDFRLRFVRDAGGWRAVAVGQGDAQVLPLVPRVKIRALPSLRVAAGWVTGGQSAEVLEEFEEIELPGPIAEGCLAVRVSGESMAGWRSEIADGDWLLIRPLSGVGFAAVEGQVVVVGRGDAEDRSYHCKRVIQDRDGAWWLRSDAPDVLAVAVQEGDEVVAVVVRVVGGGHSLEA